MTMQGQPPRLFRRSEAPQLATMNRIALNPITL